MTPEGTPIGTEDTSTDAAASEAFGRFFAPEETEEPAELDAGEAPAEAEAEEEPAEASDADETDETEPEAPAPVITLDDGTALTAEEVKKSYLRQADYTKKTQAVAEEKRAVAAEKDAVAAERATYAERLSQLDQVLAGQAPADPPPELRQTDPAEWTARKEEVRLYKEQLAAVAQERQRIDALQRQDAERKQAEYVAAEREKLVAMFPDWTTNPEKAKADLAAMRDTGAHYGFTDTELDTVVDVRAVKMLDDLTKYRQLLASTAKVQPRIAKAPVLKPGTTGKVGGKPTTNLAKNFERLKKTGDADAAAAVFDDYFKARAAAK